MTNFYKTLLTMFIGACAAPMTFAAEEGAENLMTPATLEYPGGYYVTMVPSSVSVTWDNQPIEFVDAKMDDFDEEYVDVSVSFDGETEQPAKAYIMFSEGFDGSDDLWLLDVALYDMEGIWDFDGNSLVITLPEGIVKNSEGLLNPTQDLTFYILPSFTNYTVTPETGSILASDDAVVTISFQGNPIEYNQDSVTAYIYEPEFEEIHLDYNKEVTINENNEIVVNMTTLSPGEYELVIPEGFVMVKDSEENYLSPDIWLEFTISESEGISTVTLSTRNNSVYNLNGVKVGDSLRSLIPGIYVVDGKKVLVK